MRWLLVALVVAACGKSDPTPKAETEGAVEPPAGPPATDQPPATAPPAAPPAGPALPAGARCTGRWTAALNFNSNKTCTDDELAPYTELDATLAAGPQGWTATVTKPAGLTVSAVHMTWESDQDGQCIATVSLAKPGVELSLGMSRWLGTKAHARRIDIERANGDACMGSGIQVDATFEPDSGGLPPPHPDSVAVTGRYDLALAWPANLDCKVTPPAKQQLTIGLDRANGDAFTVEGIDWNVVESRLNDPGELYLLVGRKGTSDDEDELEEIAEILFLLTVDGGKVSGTAELNMINEQEKRLCQSEAAVTGTRTAP